MSQQQELIPMEPGDFLKQKRILRKLSLATVARAIKLDEALLRKIEEGDAGHIAPVYRNGYIQSYASFLEIPKDEISSLIEQVAEEEASLRTVFSEPPKRNPVDNWLRASSYVLASLLIGTLAWQFTHEAVRLSQNGTRLPNGQEELQSAEESTQALKDPVNASITSLGALHDGTVNSTETAGQAWAAASRAPLPQGESLLQVSVSADSWIEISDADGRELEMDLLRGGSKKSYQGRMPFRILIGRASAVRLSMNGQPVDMAPFISDDVAQMSWPQQLLRLKPESKTLIEMTNPIRSIRGMNDILPEDMRHWHMLEKTAEQIFAASHYEEIRVPLLEKTEVFTRAIGTATDVVSKEMYSFDDRKSESLSLRPEGTAGVVRAVLQNGLLYGPVRRLWYGGPMFRYERPQKGRSRQFHQIGAELFGAPGADADAEILALGTQLWQRLGLKNLRLEINSLGNADERRVYRDQLQSFLRGHQAELDGDTNERVERNPLRVLDSKNPQVQALLENAPLLMDQLGEESRNHYRQLKSYLDLLGIDYHENPRLVRGLDYYCHTVFEWITDELGAQGTVCAGGRYDSLVEIQGGKPWPGIGFAMGKERLVELLRQQDDVSPARPHAYLVAVGEGSTESMLKLAYDLRAGCQDLRLVNNLNGGSFKAQFKRADRSTASLALVLGEDEIQNGQVTIKFLRSNEAQLTLDRNEILDWIRSYIDSI